MTQNKEMSCGQFQVPPCQSPCYNPCIQPGCIVPFVGATGPTGPQGPPAIESSSFNVNAAVNVATYALNQNTVTTVPFGIILSGSPGGISAYDLATGVFTVPVSGFYRVTFQLNFSQATATPFGVIVSAGLTRNSSVVTTSSYTFPALTTAASSYSIHGDWVGSFTAGDRVSLYALTSAANGLSSVLGAVVPNVAPYQTRITIASLF